MFRVAKGKSVMHTKTISILFVLLVVLNLQSSNVLICQSVKPITHKSQILDKGFALTNYVSNLQSNEYNEEEFNVTLWIRDWENKTAFRNLNVTIFDLKEQQAYSYLSNKTGYVDLKFLPTGSYVISVQSGNRIVGYKKIDVDASETIEIRTWAYDLNLTLVDKDWKPLANHTVFLYDQMVFQAPNYTIMFDEVWRNATYTLLTDHVGRLVNQAETDGNGTAHFTGMWNGTYRIKVLRKESWTEEYVLGKRVPIYQPPVSGEYVLSLQGNTNATLRCLKTDIALKFETESNIPVQNATIYVCDRSGHLFFKDRTNKTGFIEHKNVYAIDELFAISSLCGNRTISYKVINFTEIDVTETKTFTIKVWAYNLTVTIVDQEGKPLPDHVVFLHDQIVFYSPNNFTALTNQTGLLVNWTRTDKNGMSYFKDVWNGTYRIKVTGGEPIGERIINLQKPESITIKGNKTYLALTFITGSDELLSNATVYIHNSAGHIIFRDYADQNGYVRHDGIYLDNYKVVAEWMGTEVWSGIVNTNKDRELTIRCAIFTLTLRVTDPFGNPISNANVILRKMIPATRTTPVKYVGTTLELKADGKGYVSKILPSGTYETSVSYGIYSGLVIINLQENRGETVPCNIHLNVWLLTFFVASPLVGLSLLLERKRVRKPLEIRRYKIMLSKLESTYKSGLVEYKLYRKLREEYEAKLMELGGREMR